MKKTRLGKAAIGVAASAAMLLATPLSAMACTQIYVGSKFTADGNTWTGRNEDGYARTVKVFGVQQPRTGTITYKSGMSNFEWSKTGTTYRHTYIRDSKNGWNGATDAYAEEGINSEGLAVDATVSMSDNSKIDAVDPYGADPDAGENGGGKSTGIGEYNVTDILLDWCKTPKEAIELLGSLVDQYGAYDGNELTISDKNETWSFTMLSGHQWIAIKMPDDKVSVDPNMDNLQFKVDLDDPSQCIHSANLVSMPKDHGLLVTYDDGTPNIAWTYGRSQHTDSEGKNPNSYGMDRYVQGHAYFGAPVPSNQMTTTKAGRVASLADPQFFFTPGGSNYSPYFIIRSLAYRGQGTAFESNANDNIWPIGNPWSVETHFFQINNKLDSQTAIVQWEGLSRSEFTVDLPIYSAVLTKAPSLYGDIDTETGSGLDTPHQDGTDGEGGLDNVELAMKQEPAGNLDYVMLDLNTLCKAYRPTCGSIAKYEKVLQQNVIDQQEAVANLMQQVTDSSERTKIANTALDAETVSLYDRLRPVLDQLREQIKSGDTTTDFVPSDYDAAKDTIKTPFGYADSVIAPVFTQTPKAATYKQGDKAAALSATATEKDSDPLFTDSQKIKYTWYAKAKTSTGMKSVEAAAPAGYVKAGEGQTFTPDTSTVGTTEYIVRAANYEAGNYNASNYINLYTDAKVNVTVNAKSAAAVAPKSSAKKGTGAKSSTKSSTSASSSNGKLAKTGSAVEGVVAVALLAAAAGAAAVAGKKKMNN